MKPCADYAQLLKTLSLEVRKPATRPRLRADDLRARRHADYRVHQRLSFLFCDYCGETRIVSRFTVFAVIYSEKH